MRPATLAWSCDMLKTQEEDIKLMDDKRGLITATKWEIERLLKSLLAKYPNDEDFIKYLDVLGCIFKDEVRDEGKGKCDMGEASNSSKTHQDGET
ncbi:hypothetical protein L6452_03072 [Arctium lappa]|uniref:Uncharacterized protein n=1 Tax=Arctium lappa TaxID=4217 RepID=A0ACB9FL71_ARCLA|nr:hypothetical protein L6452_03072 [Arctium lappa]